VGALAGLLYHGLRYLRATHSALLPSMLADLADEQLDKALSRRDRQRQKAEREIQRLIARSQSVQQLPLDTDDDGAMCNIVVFNGMLTELPLENDNINNMMERRHMLSISLADDD
jgi:hypothetical protein